MIDFQFREGVMDEESGGTGRHDLTSGSGCATVFQSSVMFHVRFQPVTQPSVI
jgi:hypothetical protein